MHTTFSKITDPVMLFYTLDDVDNSQKYIFEEEEFQNETMTENQNSDFLIDLETAMKYQEKLNQGNDS